MSSKVQEKNKKLSKDVIIEQILKVFPNLKACADALGMTESNFSHALSRRSNKFIFRLKDLGVKFPFIDPGFTLQITNPYVREPDTRYENCLAEINSLKSELSDYKKMLSLSLSKIEELEKENVELRASAAALLKASGGTGSGKIGNKL